MPLTHDIGVRIPYPLLKGRADDFFKSSFFLFCAWGSVQARTRSTNPKSLRLCSAWPSVWHCSTYIGVEPINMGLLLGHCPALKVSALRLRRSNPLSTTKGRADDFFKSSFFCFVLGVACKPAPVAQTQKANHPNFRPKIGAMAKNYVSCG